MNEPLEKIKTALFFLILVIVLSLILYLALPRTERVDISFTPNYLPGNMTAGIILLADASTFSLSVGAPITLIFPYEEGENYSSFKDLPNDVVPLVSFPPDTTYHYYEGYLYRMKKALKDEGIPVDAVMIQNPNYDMLLAAENTFLMLS